jgi:hypothetical protein
MPAQPLVQMLGDLGLMRNGAVDIAYLQRKFDQFRTVDRGDNIIGYRHPNAPRCFSVPVEQ